MRKKMIFRLSAIMAITLGGCSAAKAQLIFSAQLRTRTELRDGYGTLESTGSIPAFFTSQRTRLCFRYLSGRVTFMASAQDVRVWGGDAATISSADGSRFGMHEAWAEILLSAKGDTSFKRPLFDHLSIRIGRQELVYDDQRLLGNLDWLQQGRRHDAIVVKLLQNNWQFDLGAAYSQNTDAFNYNGTTYTPDNVMPYVKDSKGNLVATPAGMVPLVNGSGNSAANGSPSLANPPSTNGMNQNYKSMQFLYAARKFARIKISSLVFADEFGKYSLDSVRNIAGSDTGYVYGRRFATSGVDARVTAGLLAAGSLDKRQVWKYTAGFYFQGGRNKDGQRLSAWTSTASVSFAPGFLSYTIGWDVLSGNNALSPSGTDHRFDPLYGTPHKFWGNMDYFYAGTGSASGGLNNPYFRVKYAGAGKRLTVGLDAHYFSLAAPQKDDKGLPLAKYLGSEADLVGNYVINKNSTIELGFCALTASGAMEYAKVIQPGSAKLNAYWTYLQLNFLL